MEGGQPATQARVPRAPGAASGYADGGELLSSLGALGKRYAQRRRSPLVAITVALVLLVVGLSYATSSFMSLQNWRDILNQGSVIGVPAIGGTGVILLGEIDLSTGAVVGLTGMAAGVLLEHVHSAVLALVIALATGLVIGVFNGFAVAYLRLNSFIVTLSAFYMASGLLLYISQGNTLTDLSGSVTWLGSASVDGFAAGTIMMLVFFLLGSVVLRRTVFGRHVYAIGGNREAARLSGIPVPLVIFTTFVVAGLLSAAGGLIVAGQIDAAAPTAGGSQVVLEVIAAVIIGGTSLSGGRGGLVGTLVGVLFIEIINDGLTLLNVSPFLVELVEGALIFGAIVVDLWYGRRRRRRRALAAASGSDLAAPAL